MLGAQARPCPQVREVTIHRARPDLHQVSRVRDRPASGNEGREDVHLALSRWPGERAAQVPIPHASPWGSKTPNHDQAAR